MSLLLPGETAPPDAGLTPAAFAGLWRCRSRDLDPRCVPWNASGQQEASASSASSPVRCPCPGCGHEEPTAELAILHSQRCPILLAARALGTWPGFCYCPPGEVLAALRRRSRREVAEAILDLDLGGCPGSAPRHCICEIDDEAPGLLLREVEEGWESVRIRLDTCTAVHKGWNLSSLAQRDCERGAFPRMVDLVVFSGCYDNTYDYYTSRLSGWALCPRNSRRLLSADEWSRTLVVSLRAAKNAEKQRRCRKLLHSCSQGAYDRLSVYVLGLMGDATLIDSEFPASTDRWRCALRSRLAAVGSMLAPPRRAEAEKLLAANCPAVRREDIAAEYADCETDFLFLTFATQEAGEHFHDLLQSAVQNLKGSGLREEEG